jgi:hypothetical protein
MHKFAEVLAVPAGEVEEFREVICQEACRNAPLEVLAQVEQMEVDLVDASVIRVAAQRTLKEVMEYLVRSGYAKDVDRIYRDVFGQAVRRKETSSDRDTGDS